MNNNDNNETNDDIQCDLATYGYRLSQVTWPQRFQLHIFSTDVTLTELRLTSNAEFTHKCEMMSATGTKIKAHCALCLDAKTRYGCKVCNVRLCRLPRNVKSSGINCFII
jgi:hypothetical protein